MTPRSTLKDRAAKHAAPIGRTCNFGLTIQAQPKKVRTEISELLADRTISARAIKETLSEELAIHTTAATVQRHRVGCQWCDTTGTFSA